jgi:subtilase family serine protease
MPVSRIALVLAVTMLAACSGGGGIVPPATSNPGLSTPASDSSPLRSRDSTSATPYPISALPFPETAAPFPISALPFAGAPPVAQTPACAPNTFYPSGIAICKAQINLATTINSNAHASPLTIAGVQPWLLHWIYGLPTSGGSGQTVGIVVAFDNPHAESDLAIYRQTFGLPACTTANGCFKKIQWKGPALPKADAGWSVESSLDLDAVSATCAACNIVLVEAGTNLIPDLADAVDTAILHGATVVSNSYGVAEASDNVRYAPHYVHAGVPITAAAGDVGYGVQFPASVPSVTAVGGTSVQLLSNKGFSFQEVVWPLTGAGCSAFFPKPSWQKDTGCRTRTVNDIAMIADPADGLAVYDSTFPGTLQGGWSVIGGTSLGAPLVASLFALAAKPGTLQGNATIYAAGAAQTSHSNPMLRKVTAGNDGTCSVAYLCQGVTGYNGPSGNGVPWGIGAVAP